MRKLFTADLGSEIAEAALVLPLSFMILLGIYWFGRAFNTYATINQAAREGVRVAIVQNCATCGNTPPTGPQILAAINSTLQASSVDPNQIISYSPAYIFCNLQPQATNCDTTTAITICNNVLLQNINPSATGLGAPPCGIAISFKYPYSFVVPFTSINNTTILLTADVQMAREF